jgi:hypothetical protein
MLTFGDAHAEVLLEAVEKSLGEVQVARMTPTSGP